MLPWKRYSSYIPTSKMTRSCCYMYRSLKLLMLFNLAFQMKCKYCSLYSCHYTFNCLIHQKTTYMSFSVLIGITNHTCAASLSHSSGLRFTMLLVFKGASTPTKVHQLLKYPHPYHYHTYSKSYSRLCRTNTTGRE